MAKLYFYYGTMGAGKSLRLLTTAHDFDEQNQPCLVLKSELDTRDGTDIIKTRLEGVSRECISIGKDANIKDLITSLLNVSSAYGVKKLHWILVDEAQFLTKAQVDQLAAIVDLYNINVMCYGLRTDFQTHLFEGSKRLFEVADDFVEMKKCCGCDADDGKAIFNARVKPGGMVVTSGEQIQVGGDEMYKSMCRKCYYEAAGNPLYHKNKEENDD